MLEKIFEIIGTVIGLFFYRFIIIGSMMFIFMIVMYPIVIAAFVYIGLYLLFALKQRKKRLSGTEAPKPHIYLILHASLFLLSLVLIFLTGLIACRLDQIVAWFLIPVASAYISGVITYLIFRIPKRFKTKKIVPIIATVVVSLIVFAVAEMVGLSFVVLTLM